MFLAKAAAAILNPSSSSHILFSSSSSARYAATAGARTATSTRLIQTTADQGAPETMDNNNKNRSNEKEGDVMSHSFGEGYATRSDEEGFGGVYGANQTLPPDKPGETASIKEHDPAYDKSQGSQVKEKEKGRHQKNTDA